MKKQENSKSSVWEWFNQQREKSQNEQSRVKEVAKDKIRQERENGTKPQNLWPTHFIRYPWKLKEVILKNSSNFTKIEYILLDYILAKCLGFNSWVTWYKLSEFLKYCDVDKPSFYRAWRGLVTKNIIMFHELSKDEQKTHKIYTKHAVVVNPFTDTWNITFKYNDEDELNSEPTDINQNGEQVSESNDEQNPEPTDQELLNSLNDL